jgi:hypothetical protein
MAWTHANRKVEALIDSVTGNPLVSTIYTVTLTDGTTQATIYSDGDRSSTVSQPLTTTAAGNMDFWTDPGDYLVNVGASSLSVQVLPSTADLAALQHALLNTQDNDLGGHVISNGLTPTLTKTANYTFVASDSLATIRINSGSATQHTLPNNLPVGWQVEVIMSGSGQPQFVAASGATLNNANSHTRLRAQHSSGRLEVTAQNGSNNGAVYNLAGDTAA